MKKLRVCVDTSVIGGCFDPEFEKWSNALMTDFRADRYTAVVSSVFSKQQVEFGGRGRMSVLISDETLQAAHLTAGEARQELAILLFKQDRLTLIQAARVAAMAPLPFQHFASRSIGPHYEVAELEQDLAPWAGRTMPERVVLQRQDS